jgi:acetyl-CoA acetyltransferase
MTSAAIVGLGLTAMSVAPGGAPDELAAEALRRAVGDAGLRLADIDGLLVSSSQGVRPERVGVALARSGGLDRLHLLEHVEIKGATPVAMLQRADRAVRGGMARAVACVFADAPLQAGSSAGSTYAHSGGRSGLRGLERASGLLGSVPTFALMAARYLDRNGATEDDLGAVACTTRAWAVHNPDAVVRQPLDAAGYAASPMVATPLRRADCARPVNGAAAIVVAARGVGDGRWPPVYVQGMAQWHPCRRRRAPEESWFAAGPDAGAREAVDEVLRQAGRRRSDVDVLEISDPFTIVSLGLLEAYGFCDWGQAGAFVRSGETGPGGALPTNTGGGQLSGFYLQGMTPLVEAIVQLRGAGEGRQVPGAATALVGAVGGRVDHHALVVLDREDR